MRFRPLSLLVIGLAAPAAGQWPPVVRNLQVLPKETKFSSRIDTMKAFTRALGVRCTYCHVGKEGEPLETYDFASDDRGVVRDLPPRGGSASGGFGEEGRGLGARS